MKLTVLTALCLAAFAFAEDDGKLTIDIPSSVQATIAKEKGEAGKVREFKRVNESDGATYLVGLTIDGLSYGNILLPVQIPKTKVATGQAVKFGTVFDSEQTGQKAVKAYEQLVVEVEVLIQQSWQRQLEALNG